MEKWNGGLVMERNRSESKRYIEKEHISPLFPFFHPLNHTPSGFLVERISFFFQVRRWR
jgi:hypothetical protein